MVLKERAKEWSIEEEANKRGLEQCGWTERGLLLNLETVRNSRDMYYKIQMF